MKLHPATKKARAILRKMGFDTSLRSTLTLQMPGEVCERPFFIDIEISQHHHDVARLNLCPQLQDGHSLFNRLHELHMHEFTYQE